MRSLQIAGTGMLAQQTNVEVISNNIANMSTTGYKRRRAEFEDLLYQNMRRVGSQSSESGSMLPAGGVKGAMLALTVELLVCALSGAAYGFESDSFFTEEGRPTRIGQAILAIDPRALAGSEVYLERVETLVEAMSADPEVRLPGERRRRNAEQARREGVIIPDDLMARIRALAGEASNA